MKKILQCSLLCLSFLMFTFAFANNAAVSPIGYWKTIDDVTHRPQAIMRIYRSGNTLSGEIVKIFPGPGHDQNQVCTACTGYRHNKRIVGMVIMDGFTQNPSNPAEWNEGHILDPSDNETYRCMLTISPDNRTLNVRGYIGVSMFGRTQTWIRVK